MAAVSNHTTDGGRTASQQSNRKKIAPPPILVSGDANALADPGAKEDTMIPILIACLAVSGSIVIVAFPWNRIRGVPISVFMPPGFRSVARFAGGPFTFSIAIHIGIILALVIAVHESRARELLIVRIAPGSLHSPEAFEPLEIPDVPMPAFNTKSPDDSPQLVDVNKVLGANSSAIAGTTSERGLGLNHHFGNYMNLHPGPGGGGGGTFPWYVDELRHKGLDIVLVIDGTKSMDFVMADVKERKRCSQSEFANSFRSRESAS